MRNNKKITALVLCLCMLLLIVPVTGNAETLYSFEDDFSSYSNAMYTSFGTAMQQNWRTPTSGECDRSAINMGYNDGKLKISTNTVTTDVKYTTGNSLVFPCAVLTAGRDDLLPGQKISVKAKKTHFSDMWGVRFYVHNGNNGTLNYYTLLIGGMYTYAVSGGRLTWGLYKCTNGTVTTLTERVRSNGLGTKDDIDGYIGTGYSELELTYLDGEISWTLNYTNGSINYSYDETFIDLAPFYVDGSDTTVHLYSAGSDDPSRFIYFDDFKIESVESSQTNTNYRYADDFSSYTNAMYTDFGVTMQHNWRTTTAEECLRPSLNMGYNNGQLKINTNTSTTDIKYTTSNALEFPAAVLTASRNGLLSGQTISVRAKKTHISDMWGVRFYVHNGTGGTMNYYTLLFGGLYTHAQDSGYLTWGLYKSVNGTVTKLDEKIRNGLGSADDIDGYMGTGYADLEITYLKGKIEWNLSYTKDNVSYSYNNAYTDASPFDIDGKNTTVHLYAAGSDDSSRYVYFDNFILESYVPYITSGEPNDVMYFNASEGKQKNGDGVIDLGKGVVIRKLIYSGGSANGSVLVSKDNESWDTLTDLNEFTGGKFVNRVTDDSYRYISIGAAQGDLTVLTDVSEYEGIYTDSAVKLYPRIGGCDYFSDNDNVLSTDDDSLIKINGTFVSPGGVGTANLIAGANGRSFSIPVTYKNGIFSYYDSFDNCGTSTFTGQNIQFDKAWRSKTVAEGEMGYNNDAAIGYNNNRIFVQARGVKDGDSFSRYPRWAGTVPAAVFNADHNGLTSDQVIKVKITKTSGTESSGVRFMVHNNGNSYYLLLFPGMYGLGGLTDKDSNYSSWELIKCEGGQYTMLARAERSDNTGDIEGGFLSRGTGDLTIEYVDGKITWNMPVLRDGTELFEWSGEYEDAEPYTLSGNDATVWLISGLYSGDTASRGTYFDDIKIASYVPYITLDEPNAVLYKDLLENKNAVNGIYELDAAENIRRVISKNVSGSLKVFTSNDNNTWYKICGFDNNGEFLNNIYAEKFRYIKTEGAGAVSVLSEIDDSGIFVKTGETLNIYPYIDGVLYLNPLISEETGCIDADGYEITGISAIRNDSVTVSCGAIEQEMKVTVPLINASYVISPQGNNAVITVTAEELRGVNCDIVITFYNSDHSFGSIETFAASFNNGTESVTVNNYYLKGDSAKLMIWNNSAGAAPYSKVISLNINKQN